MDWILIDANRAILANKQTERHSIKSVIAIAKYDKALRKSPSIDVIIKR